MKASVLVVDDSVTVREDLRWVLEAAGFALTLCENLAAARRALALGRFELLILDMVLPDGEGVELLREVRASPRTAQLPVLVLSTEVAVGSRLRGLGCGASDYVGKPYDAAYVVKRASELTGQPVVEGGMTRLVSAGKHRRVLLVDDSASFRQVAAEELRKDGHDVVLAESGEEALRLLQAQTVDCILLDVVMPGLSGVEVARQVRSMPRLANTPVVMLTASYQGKVMSEALAVGVDAFCLKTEDFGLLRAQVRNELRRRVQAEAQAPEASKAAPASGGSAGGVLFEALVACCGLSQVIASSTMSRACRRAGVEAQELTVDNLARVLPSIRETLRVFLSQEELETRMQAISALANPERVQRTA